MKKFLFFLFILLRAVIVLHPDTIRDQPPDLHAPSAILIDYATGRVLVEKQADMIIPPASLTKLVTLHLVYSRLKEGLLEAEEPVPIPESAWAENMPEGSSLMFLGPGQRVTVMDLMKGLAVSSGNDAAEALAIIAAGSVDGFAGEMNRAVRDLGFENMLFTEPAGLSELNRITAREFARFCRTYIQLHPHSLEELHSVKSYTFPGPEHLENGVFARSFTQFNRNGILWELDYVDGLKTGYIDESGYNLAVTGMKEGMRLIGVILGIEAENHRVGGSRRNEDGRELLSYGFEHFETLRPKKLSFPRVKVWKGVRDSLAVESAVPVVLTIRKTARDSVTTELQFNPQIEAPVSKGDIVGELIVYAEGNLFDRFPLAAAENVERAGIVRVVYDSILLFFRNL